MHLFKTLHDIVFYGNGGYDYNTIYNMPLWLRKFTFFQIQNHFKEKSPETSPNTTTLVDSSGNVNKSEFKNATKQFNVPSYVTKASKK